MPFTKEEDIVKLVRGNDSHAYLYVNRKEGSYNIAMRQGGEIVGGNGCASLPTVGGIQGCVNVVPPLLQNGERVFPFRNYTR